MAGPFKPKFVDLVRNFTTTTGTGDITLGAAVAGHSSLAGSVAAGERFHYCVMGIDKPTEREVGRGTMTAAGTVAREPAGGVATNFSAGMKTIALVVGADWYGTVGGWINGGSDSLSALATSDKSSLVAAVNEVAAAAAGGGSGAAAGAPTFLAAAGSAIAPSATTVATSGYGVAGRGAARYLYDAAVDAGYVAAHPRTAFVAAGGRGFRLDPDQPLDLLMFGASGDYNPTAPGVLGVDFHDDLPAFQAMIAFVAAAAAQTSGNTSFRQAPRVTIPARAYYMSDAVDLYQASFDLRGAGRAGATNGATFYFAPGKDGFRVQWVNTSGKTGTGSFGSCAGGSHFEQIHAWSLGNATGASGSGSAGQQDGWTIRAPVTMTRCTASNFSRNGFAIDATVGGAMQGNANGCVLTDCGGFRNAGRGIFVNGGDANACLIDRFSAYYNGYAGIHDNSFLGNSWIAPEEGDNGGIGAGPTWGPSTVGSFCRFDAGDGAGLYVWQVRRGQAAACATTAPANAAGNPWKRLVPGYVNALYPPWTSGTAFIDGASYIFENASSASTISGGYTEGTSPSPSIVAPTIVVGGLLAAAVEGGPGLRSGGNLLQSGTGFRQLSSARARTDGTVAVNQVGSGDPQNSGRVLYAADGRYSDSVNPASPQTGIELGWDSTTKNLQWRDTNSGATVFQITGRYSAYQFGRGAAQAGFLHSGRLMVGNGNEARELGSATAMPTSGTYAQGDFIRNTLGSVSGGAVLLGWYRLTDGSAHVAGTDWHACVVANAVAGGGGGLTNGDKGDVVVAGNGASLTVESASPAGGTFLVSGVLSVTGGAGVSGTLSAASAGFTGTVNVAADLNISGAAGGIAIASRNSGAGWTLYNSGGVLALWQGGDVAQFGATGINLTAGRTLQVNGVPVVGARGAAVADATDAASAITQLNALLARCRAHGLIA